MTSPSNQQRQQPFDDDPSFTTLLQLLQNQPNKTDTETASLATTTEKLDINEQTALQDKVDAYCKEFLYIGGPEVLARKQQVENTKGN
jgi:hypothetical protein